MSLLNVLPYDKTFYKENLKEFLPKTFIDCHTHIWLDEQNYFCVDEAKRTCALAEMVALDNSVEDLNETNRLLFPDNREVSCRTAAQDGLFFYPFTGYAADGTFFKKGTFTGLDLSHERNLPKCAAGLCLHGHSGGNTEAGFKPNSDVSKANEMLPRVGKSARADQAFIPITNSIGHSAAAGDRSSLPRR